MIAIDGELRPNLKFADLQVHSSDSDGKLSAIPLVKMAVRLGRLDALAITDHFGVQAALEARRFAKNEGLKIEVIPGMEVKTKQGDMVALFIEESIPAGEDAQKTAELVHAQGGLVYAPHPFFRLFGASSFGLGYSQYAAEAGFLDGYEVFNAGLEDWNLGRNNQSALDLYRVHGLKLGAPLATSDSHGYTVGRAFVGYEGDLYTAIKEAQTIPIRLDTRGEERLLRLAVQYHGWGSLEMIHKIRKHRNLPRIGIYRDEIEVVVAKANRAVTEEDVAEFLSPKELDRFHSKHPLHKPGWAASRLAAKIAFQTFDPRVPLPEIVIENHKQEGKRSGPPYSPKFPKHFVSLSHWGEYGAAVAGNHRVGIDLSGLRPTKRHEDRMRLLELSNRITADDELDIFKLTVSDKDLITILWSVREAGWKGLNTGIDRENTPLKLTAVPDSNDTFRIEVGGRSRAESWLANVMPVGNLHLAVAYPQEYVPNEFSLRFENSSRSGDPTQVLTPFGHLPAYLSETALSAFDVRSLNADWDIRSLVIKDPNSSLAELLLMDLDE